MVQPEDHNHPALTVKCNRFVIAGLAQSARTCDSTGRCGAAVGRRDCCCGSALLAATAILLLGALQCHSAASDYRKIVNSGSWIGGRAGVGAGARAAASVVLASDDVTTAAAASVGGPGGTRGLPLHPRRPTCGPQKVGLRG